MQREWRVCYNWIMKKLLLVDGHNLLFRMFFGMPFPFYNDNNVNITGTVGFVGTVVKMIKYLNVDECLVVFDGESSRSVREDVDYKANRPDYGTLSDEENPFTQLTFIKAVLDYLNIKWIETERIECDDYIAIISKKYDGEVFISSTDTDFYQLINGRVKVIKFKGKNTEFIDEKFIYEKFSVLPTDFTLYKAIIGDAADNIKGIHKVGPKTAVKIINALKNNITDKFLEIYTSNLETIKRNLNLIELPNSSIDINKYELENYEVVSASFVNFKNLQIVTELTNKIK